MPRSYKQKHLRQRHKTTHIRRQHYFHAEQQDLQSPLSPTIGFSSIAAIIDKYCRHEDNDDILD